MRIGILVGLFLLAGIDDSRARSSKTGRAFSDLRQIGFAIGAFEIDFNRVPEQKEGLQVLVDGAEEGPPNQFIDQDTLIDPWGNPYQFVIPSKHSKAAFELFSFGPDGISKTGGNDPDDIALWRPASAKHPKHSGEFVAQVMLLLLVLLIAFFFVHVLWPKRNAANG